MLNEIWNYLSYRIRNPTWLIAFSITYELLKRPWLEYQIWIIPQIHLNKTFHPLPINCTIENFIFARHLLFSSSFIHACCYACCYLSMNPLYLISKMSSSKSISFLLGIILNSKLNKILLSSTIRQIAHFVISFFPMYSFYIAPLF